MVLLFKNVSFNILLIAICFFCHCLSLLVAMVTKMQKITKNTFKNLLLWNHWSDWAQIVHVASFGLGNESLFFYENRPISLVAMAT